MKKILAILIIVLLIAGIGVGLYLVKIQQIFKSKATLEGTRIEIVDSSGNILTSVSSRSVKVKLIHAATQTAASPVPSSPAPTPTPRPTPSSRPNRVNMNVRGGIRFFNEDCLTPYNGSGTLRVLTTAQLVNGSWENSRGHNDLFYPTSHNVNQNPEICQKTEYHPYEDPGYQINADGTFAGCPPENMDSGEPQQDCANRPYERTCSQCYDNNGDPTDGCCEPIRDWYGDCPTVWSSRDNDVCMRDSQQANVFPRCFSARSSHFEVAAANPVLSLSSERSTKRTFSVGAPSDMQLKVIRTCTANGCDWGQVQNPNNPNRGSTIKDFSTLNQGHVNYFAIDFETASGNERAWVYDICVKTAGAVTVTPVPASSPITSPSPSPPVNVFPTHFRLANFQSGLEYAQEQVFDQNGKQADWRLASGNGQKTVYAQYKVNGVWENPLSSQVALNYTDPLGPKYGMQIDVRDQAKIPAQAQADLIRPGWVRFVYPCTNLSASPNCPDDWHKVNLISSIPNPDTIKRLAIINGETAWGSPVGSTDVSLWTAYINNNFLPVLREVLKSTDSRLSAIELWNEEDHSSDPNVQPYVPPLAFAYLLKSSSALIRSINPALDIVVGGVLSGAEYLKAVKTAEADAFADIDAIGVHPYVTPDHINNITTIINALRQSNSEAGINLPIWITEMGIQEFSHPSVPKNQREFMEKAFDQIVVLSPIPQIVNWYAFIDTMTGSDRGLTWGLFSANGSIKPAGEFFKDINNPVLSSPSAVSSPLPSSSVPSPSPASSVTPAPSSPSASPVPSGAGVSPSPALRLTDSQDKSADFNRDGKINSIDVSLLFSKWNSRIPADLNVYDLNSDGVINSFDYVILKSKFRI